MTSDEDGTQEAPAATAPPGAAGRAGATLPPMQGFVWGPDYETGLAEIDHQHQALVDLINRLGSEAYHQQDALSVEHILDELAAYAVNHFSTEVRYMQEAGLSPAYMDHHMGIHGQFVRHFLQVRALLESGSVESVRTLVQYLISWLGDHILGEDQAMALQIRDVRAGVSPEAALQLARRAYPGTQSGALMNAMHGMFDELARSHAELRSLNAELDARVQARTAELSQIMGFLELEHERSRQSLLGTVRVLSGLIDLRASGVGGHSRRVTEWVRQTAMRMQVSEAELQDMTLGALLHDIGKITLDNALLSKADHAMAPDERRELMKHAVSGQMILMEVQDLRAPGLMVRHHHERYDGTGYPDGLAGQEIPLGARVIAIANEYDGLVKGRLFARRLSHEEACRFIDSAKGKRYDPEIAEAFLSIAREAQQVKEPGVRIPVVGLKPGMVLARNLLHHDGALLLARGHQLDARAITLLGEMEEFGLRPLDVFITAKTGQIQGA